MDCIFESSSLESINGLYIPSVIQFVAPMGRQLFESWAPLATERKHKPRQNRWRPFCCLRLLCTSTKLANMLLRACCRLVGGSRIVRNEHRWKRIVYNIVRMVASEKVPIDNILNYQIKEANSEKMVLRNMCCVESQHILALNRAHVLALSEAHVIGYPPGTCPCA